MRPVFTFDGTSKEVLQSALASLDSNPYRDYETFRQEIAAVIGDGAVSRTFAAAARDIVRQRENDRNHIHLITNCPLDDDIPVFGQADPLEDKYTHKSSYVGEAMLEIVGQLTGTPLLAYTTRNNGDFFHDVYAQDRYARTQTQKSDGDLYFHNDRTAHPVRADYLALLGMRCPAENLVYTGYVDGGDLLVHISAESQELLRHAEFVTPFDEYSRDSNHSQGVSDPHAVLENRCSLRYYDTRTRPADRGSASHYRALMELRDGLVKARRERHRIRDGDMLLCANQDGLHNRELVDMQDVESGRLRWLLKTYAFRDDAAADKHADRWAGGVRGRVLD